MSAYRRAARPSGAALTRARDAAVQELAARTRARDEQRAELEALELLVAEERAVHDQAVRRAEEDRIRALRLVLATAKHVPDPLRSGIEKEARLLKLEHLLERPSQPPGARPVPRPEDAMARLHAAREERAQHAASQAIALETLRLRLSRAEARVREAEDDLRRLVD